jgi:hypothetical protein
MNYLVTYSMVMEADSPEEAAKKVHKIIMHPDKDSLYTYDVHKMDETLTKGNWVDCPTLTAAGDLFVSEEN